MDCPSCGSQFNQEVYEDVTIDVCSSCSGVWLDGGEMEQINSKREQIFKPNEVQQVNRLCGVSGVSNEEEARELPCPKCSKGPMKTFNYNYSSGIVIDRCSDGCGLWLDADELDKIQIHSELWQDKLEANRERFEILAGQVEQDARDKIQQIDEATGPSRFRFVNTLLRGVVRF